MSTTLNGLGNESLSKKIKLRLEAAMSSSDSSLRLRPWASLVLFLSAYSPLLIILIIKDYDPIHPACLPKNPTFSGILLLVAIFSSIAILRSVKEISGGLPVVVT